MKDFPAEYRFCPYDGSKILNECKKCKKNMDPLWTFCPFDGTKIAIDVPTTTTSPKTNSPTNNTVTSNQKTETSSTKDSSEKSSKESLPVQENNKKTTSGSTQPLEIDDLPAVDLVKKFIECIEKNDRKTANRLVDWDEYYKSYLQLIQKFSEMSPQEWSSKRDAFQEKMLSRIFSETNIKLNQQTKKKHYVLKMNQQKTQVIVYSKIDNRPLQNIFSLSKIQNRFRITFIE
jgi:hypothetical protein